MNAYRYESPHEPNPETTDPTDDVVAFTTADGAVVLYELDRPRRGSDRPHRSRSPTPCETNLGEAERSVRGYPVVGFRDHPQQTRRFHRYIVPAPVYRPP